MELFVNGFRERIQENETERNQDMVLNQTEKYHMAECGQILFLPLWMAAERGGLVYVNGETTEFKTLKIFNYSIQKMMILIL